MIQVLPARERRPSTGQRVSEALGQALVSGSRMYAQHQKQKQFDEAIKNIEGTYQDPNLTPEQKFVRAFSSLRNFPEAAKQFSTGMAHFTETPLQAAQRRKILQGLEEDKAEESYLSRLMGGGQERGSQQQEMPEETFAPDEAPSARAPKAKFNSNDPTSWSDRQIEEFRAIEGRTPKAKTLARRAQNEFDRRQESKKATAKYEENVAPLHGALDILGQMEKIGTRGNLGIGTTARGIISPKTRRDAAEYERLGKSLIQFSTNIPIRNRQEFETLAHDLYDPSISDDSREGILAAMRRIIANAIQGHQAPEMMGEEQPTGGAALRAPVQKERAPLKSFFR